MDGMPIQDALPSGDAGCSGRPPAADGESFILPPPPADRSKTRHRSARNEEATPNHAPSQACALLGQSRQAPSISPPPNPPNLSLCTACRRKGAIFFFRSESLNLQHGGSLSIQESQSQLREASELVGKKRKCA
jgi:hypothetical protein